MSADRCHHCDEQPCSCQGLLRRTLRVAGLESEPTECTMREFCTLNEDLDGQDLDALIALHPGGSVEYGGGAAPLVTVTRVS